MEVANRILAKSKRWRSAAEMGRVEADYDGNKRREKRLADGQGKETETETETAVNLQI